MSLRVVIHLTPCISLYSPCNTPFLIWFCKESWLAGDLTLHFSLSKIPKQRGWALNSRGILGCSIYAWPFHLSSLLVIAKFSLLKQSSPPHFSPHSHPNPTPLIISSGIKWLVSPAVAMTTVGLHLPLGEQCLFEKRRWQLLAPQKPGSKLVFTCLGREVPVHSTLGIFLASSPSSCFSDKLPASIQQRKWKIFSDKNVKSLLACHNSIH